MMKTNLFKAWLKFSNSNKSFTVGHTTQKPDIAKSNNSSKVQKIDFHTESENKKSKQPTSVSNTNTEIIKNITIELEKINDLEDLFHYIKNLPYCPLKNFAQNTVLFDGNKNSKIMLIGEAPGEDEDIEGRPFCGKSGKLLDNILNTFFLDRTKIYITNVLPWRPPANRKPSLEEINMFKPIVEKHISLINPELIIAIGSTAMTCLLDDGNKISENTGNVFEYNNSFLKTSKKLTVIYHPAFLIRNYKMKKKTWQDIIKIQNETQLF